MLKNFKIGKTIKKLTALGLTATLSTSIVGCSFVESLKNFNEKEEIKNLKELDDNRAYHLYFNGNKVLTVDEIVDSNFQFTKEDNELDENGKYKKSTDSKTYKIVKKDNINYLIDARTCSIVYLYGFEKLGTPFYLKYYDSKNGGQDAIEGLSGYVLPYTDNKGNIYLVDFDTFEPILMGVSLKDIEILDNPSIQESGYGKSCEDIRNYLETFYIELEFYNNKSNGIDEAGMYSGYTFEIMKNGVRYLVDCTHPDKIILRNYKGAVEVHNEANPGFIEVTNAEGKKEQYLEDALPIEEKSNSLKIIP